jgi:putative phosphoesterase
MRMKYIAAGDIHGSVFFTNCLVERINELRPEKVVLLGDIYGHTYNNEIDEILLSSGVEIESVEGNGDNRTAVLSRLNFIGSCIMEYSGGRRFLFTHGHIYNRYNLPFYMKKDDVFIYGHTHNTNIAKERGVNIINAGSIARPRGISKNSFVFINDNVIEIREVENGNLIERLQLEVNADK